MLTSRVAGLALATAIGILGLTGCTSGDNDPSPQSSIPVG